VAGPGFISSREANQDEEEVSMYFFCAPAFRFFCSLAIYRLHCFFGIDYIVSSVELVALLAGPFCARLRLVALLAGCFFCLACNL
jgi:hypothetical protein